MSKFVIVAVTSIEAGWSSPGRYVYGYLSPTVVVMSVAALPMSIWPQAMSYLRQSSEIDLVRPVMACFVGIGAGYSGFLIAAQNMVLEFGDRYFVDDDHYRVFMHLPDRKEILDDLAATGWTHEWDEMRRRVAPESKAVNAFTASTKSCAL